MKALLKLILISLSIGLILSCAKKEEYLPPAEIKGLTSYVDTVINMQIKIPENWINTPIKGKGISAFSLKGSQKRFLSYHGKGDPGARIYVNTMKMDSTRPFEEIESGSLIFHDSVIAGPDTVYFEDSVKAIKYEYDFTLNDGQFKGNLFVASKDSSLVTVLKFETFGDTWDKYSADFAKIQKDMILGVAPEETLDTIVVKQQLPLPSSNLTPKSGKGYTINIPDNFKVSKYPGASVYARKYEGERRLDSYVVVEVLKNSKKDLKKIVELNAKQMGADKVDQVKVNGQDAFMFSMKATPKVNRRIYFLKKGETPFRLIVDYSVEEEDNYLPIFEKCVNTFKMK